MLSMTTRLGGYYEYYANDETGTEPAKKIKGHSG